MVLFQMTYLGAPMIYYGDEVGMWGGDDPDDRKPMLWTDLQYEDETHHPFGKSRPVDKNTFNSDLFQYYKSLISIRRNNDALQLGDFTTLLTDDKSDIYAFIRTHQEQRVIVIINNSSLTQLVTAALPKNLQSQKWESVFAEKSAEIREGRLEVNLSAKSGVILSSKH